VKVAIVAEYPAEPDCVVGGVQAAVRRLAVEMARRPGLEVHAVSFELGRREALVEDVEGVRVHRFPMPRRFGNVTLGWAERRETAAALRRIAPDIAHAHVLGPATLGTADSGVPWVATAHGIQALQGRLLEGWVNRIRAHAYDAMERMSLRRVRHLIVISPYVLTTFEGRLEGRATYAIENPVEEMFFRIASPGDPRTILVSGRVIPRKDPRTLLEAVAPLAKRGEEFSVRFAGPTDDSDYFDVLVRSAKELGLEDRLRFLGSLSPNDLAKEMESAGLVVLPSIEETAPLAVMEAMAAGRAVIATDTGGNRHLVDHGRTGWIVPVRDARAMSLAIEQAWQDPQGTRARGARGRETALARFHVEAVVSRTLEVYHQVVAASSQARNEKSLDREFANV
jgi:glycosyltransferase involved in cell wall biosynthesis